MRNKHPLPPLRAIESVDEQGADGDENDDYLGWTWDSTRRRSVPNNEQTVTPIIVGHRRSVNEQGPLQISAFDLGCEGSEVESDENDDQIQIDAGSILALSTKLKPTFTLDPPTLKAAWQ